MIDSGSIFTESETVDFLETVNHAMSLTIPIRFEEKQRIIGAVISFCGLSNETLTFGLNLYEELNRESRLDLRV